MIIRPQSILPVQHEGWKGPSVGKPPSSFLFALVVMPVVFLWTLPQSLVGLAYAVYCRFCGLPWFFYRFGAMLFLVVPGAPSFLRGISLGVVVMADEPNVLTHEFCHLYTAAWLSWIYLPVYGLEYLLMGHDDSFHERITCAFELRTTQAWKRVAQWGTRSSASSTRNQAKAG